jgi:hypothetical protein
VSVREKKSLDEGIFDGKSDRRETSDVSSTLYSTYASIVCLLHKVDDGPRSTLEIDSRDSELCCESLSLSLIIEQEGKVVELI